MIFFSFQKSKKKTNLKMPEATNIAASSTESFPGYSVLDGQYELHETGNFYFLEKLIQVKYLNLIQYQYKLSKRLTAKFSINFFTQHNFLIISLHYTA